MSNAGSALLRVSTKVSLSEPPSVILAGMASPSLGRLATAAATSSSVKNKFICRISCLASQSPTPRYSPMSLRRAATPPNLFHLGSGADSPMGPHSPHSASCSRWNTSRVMPAWPPEEEEGRAAASARRMTSGRACSTPTLPARWYRVSSAAEDSCAPMKACRHPGTSCTILERSCRPAVSESVSTMTAPPGGAFSTAAATSAITSLGTL
mmetsp:Transcript_24307/g.59739  ORF Transcript_24307/g.59739 Transcript_24307/m.59739 type:complete len:210 (-) Transcript_24307:203-832(-)